VLAPISGHDRQRNPYPVALIGHAEASKTSTILALLDVVAQHGAEVLGVRSFAATEQTIRNLARNEPRIFSNFREGIGPQGNEQEHHPPRRSSSSRYRKPICSTTPPICRKARRPSRRSSRP
jgi:hypothetical protein